jgi:hypothetical protein
MKELHQAYLMRQAKDEVDAYHARLDDIIRRAETERAARQQTKLEGATQMKWSVTEVQPAEAGAGFVLYDDRRKPCVEFGYASYEAAEEGWEKLLDTLKGAVTVKGLG